MAFPPPPVPGQPPLFGAPPFPMPPGHPGMQPPPGAGILPLAPPGMPPMGFPPPPLGMVPPPIINQHTVSAPPTNADGKPIDVPMVMSTATMKVQTTVFVGNISEKASDTLVRQILLRCGQIEGWKRVKDASGKLQAFGFCEYALPESTLRAIRLLDGLKLGEKALVVKVDAKTRKDLLKYIITKKKGKDAKEEEVEAEVNKLEEEGRGTAALTDQLSEEMTKEDGTVKKTIDDLLRDHLAVLSSSKTNEDVQREHDVQESILFMAKQSGNVDPDTTLDQVDMEDDMKMLVSDEIKRFRESYQKAEEKQHLKVREKLKEKEREKERSKDRGEKSETSAEKEKEKEKESKKPLREPSPPRRERNRTRRGRSRSRSPRRSRSPIRSRSQERAERERKREAQREKEREMSARDEEEYEEKLRQRRMRERDKAYREQLMAWESRERRKAKDYDRELKRDEERREDMEHEKRHLADFLREYDDERDDQQFYKSSLFNRRRSERELEMEDDERDRRREIEELETLRLEVMEKQARDKLGRRAVHGSSSESSPRGEEEEEEDMEVPARHELEEDIPLTKTGYTVPASFTQIQSAPAVQAPEIKGHPKERSVGDGIMIAKAENLKQDGESPASRDSPQPAKLAFGLMKKMSSSGSGGSAAKNSKLESIFSTEEEEMDLKPKKKLVPINYSDEEDQSGIIGEEQAKKTAQSRHGKAAEKGESGDVSMKLALLKPADSGKKLSSEDRKKLVQSLVNNIPTLKEEVFKYEIKWEQIDQTLIEKRVGPWINKKITEYIGESEPVLTEFICNKLACHVAPSEILNDIAMVLDDEAEVFVVKLWRLLIYETEAKHLGIAKNY